MIDLTSHKDISFSSVENIKKNQEMLLKDHIKYCMEHSKYYRELLGNRKVDPLKVTLDNLHTLPFTEKVDLANRNDDFCATPIEKIVDIVLSSGTTGEPTRVMYTDYDLKRLAYNEKKSLESAGVSASDVVLLSCTMDRCFVAGLAYFLGVRATGAAAIRNGHNSLESHYEIIKKMNPTVIIGVPTFLRKLGEHLKKKGLDPAETNVSRLICIGEPLRGFDLNFLRVGSELEDLWHAKAFSTYASSETVTTFCECTQQQGGHLLPSLAIVEIIDEEGNLLPVGDVGEVVVTPLAVEGMPLIRFKTGDMSFLIDEPCVCGRNSNRLGPILGRKKQMMKIKGTTLYPQAVYAALEEIGVVKDFYITVDSESNLSDILKISVSVTDDLCTSEKLQEQLQAKLRVKPAVEITPEEKIKEKVYTSKSRKPVRFIDRRKQYGQLSQSTS